MTGRSTTELDRRPNTGALAHSSLRRSILYCFDPDLSRLSPNCGAFGDGEGSQRHKAAWREAPARPHSVQRAASNSPSVDTIMERSKIGLHLAESDVPILGRQKV